MRDIDSHVRRALLPLSLLLLVVLELSSMSVHALEFEKKEDVSISQRADGEVVSVGDVTYSVWRVQSEMGAQIFAEVPNAYRGEMPTMTLGEMIDEKEAMKIVDEHYRESAFDYGSMVIRKFEVTGLRYVVTCDNVVIGCVKHSFHAGTVISFESNGKNRLGGMTGFEPVSLVVTKITAGGLAPAAVTTNVKGRIAVKSAELLLKEATETYRAATDKPPGNVMTAISKTLNQEGLSIATTNEELGMLVTVPQQIKLDGTTANCGKTFGISFLTDKRTETTALFAFKVTDGSISVRTAIDGIQRINSMIGAIDHPLTCTSNGRYEGEIVRKALAGL